MPIKGMDKVMRKALALQKAMAGPVPVKMQAAAVRVFRDNFKAQGWVDRGVKPWKQRATEEKRKGRSKPRKILIGRTSLLINSIERNGQATWNSISVKAGGPHVPYARIHNEGGEIRGTFGIRQHGRRTRAGGKATVRQHTRTVNTTIPQRRFMGDSHALRQAMRKVIGEAVVKTMLSK